MQEYSDEIAKMGPVRSNLEIREDLGRLEALLQDVRKRQLNTERILNLSDSTEEMNAMMDEILHQLHKLEDAVNTPALFRSRRKK
jgi:hypothetical protein